MQLKIATNHKINTAANPRWMYYTPPVYNDNSIYCSIGIRLVAKFDTNVFINYPIDKDYRQLLLAIVFTNKYLGMTPLLSVASSDSGETRVLKIVELIRKAKFGIHDLSRMSAVKKGEYYRMNMPFELGIDYGCKKLKGGKWTNKKLLVLDKKKYRYQAAISDLAGSDIGTHANNPSKVIKVVRDWIVTEVLGVADSPLLIWYDFNDFTADLEINLRARGYRKNQYNGVPISEVMAYMDKWLSA